MNEIIHTKIVILKLNTNHCNESLKSSIKKNKNKKKQKQQN